MYCISSYHTLSQRFFLLKPLVEDKAWRPWGDTECWVTFPSFHYVYLIPHQKSGHAEGKKKSSLSFWQILSRSHQRRVWRSDLWLLLSILISPKEKNNSEENKTKVCWMSRINTVCYKLKSSREGHWFPIDAELCCSDSCIHFSFFSLANCTSRCWLIRISICLF